MVVIRKIPPAGGKMNMELTLYYFYCTIEIVSYDPYT